MNPIIARYKIPFLIALLVGLFIVVFGGVSKWYEAVFTFLGAILGMLLIDFEYVLFAYIVDPQHESSMEIKEYLKKGNISGFVNLINEKEYGFDELSVRSIVFIAPLLLVTFYAISGRTYFAEALMMTMLLCLYYSAIIEYIKTKTLKRWFWGINVSLNNFLYTSTLIVIGISAIYLFTFI